jgi:hypothetical protein
MSGRKPYDKERFKKIAQKTFSAVGGRVLLASIVGAPQARELAELQHGAFTFYALDLLRNNAGLVTVDSLFDGISRGLEARGLPPPIRSGMSVGTIVLREPSESVGTVHSTSVETEKLLYMALLSAFPTRSELERLVDFRLGINLDSVARTGSLSETVFNLIQWAKATGKLHELIEAAVAENPANPELRAYATHQGFAELVGYVRSSSSNPPVQMTWQMRRDLYNQLRIIRDDNQLREYCFYLKIKYDDLEGDDLPSKIQNFMNEMERQNRVEDLAQVANEIAERENKEKLVAERTRQESNNFSNEKETPQYTTQHLDYVNFDLEIAHISGLDYTVTVRSGAGEAQEVMRFPFDELALENRLLMLQNALLRSRGHARRILSHDEQTVEDFGRTLFDALFKGEVRSRYDMSQQQAFDQDKGLRLKLRIKAPELATVPWEFLYDHRRSEFLCLSVRTPIVRYLEMAHPIRPLVVKPPLRILGMISSPSNLPYLDLENEKNRVERALQDLQVQGRVSLTWLAGQTWRDLQRAMRNGPWHVFHFIGHGDFDQSKDEGVIALVDENGQRSDFSATQLGRLLVNHGYLRLVVLNSCEGAKSSNQDIFSSTAGTLIHKGIPAVVAMQYEISDRAAIEFARVFYEALVDELPVDAAVSEARVAISSAVSNTVEWGTPTLYMRSTDGVLLHFGK